MVAISTTLNAILGEGFYGQEPKSDGTKYGYLKLLDFLGKTKPDDEPLPLVTILESNGLEDAIWCWRLLGRMPEWRMALFACDMAELALPIFEEKYPDDAIPRKAIELSRQYVKGGVSVDDLIEARRSLIPLHSRAQQVAYADLGGLGFDLYSTIGAAAFALEAAKGNTYPGTRMCAGYAFREVKAALHRTWRDCHQHKAEQLFIKYFGEQAND